MIPTKATYTLPYGDGSGDQCSVSYTSTDNDKFKIKIDDELYVSVDHLDFLIEALQAVREVHLESVGSSEDDSLVNGWMSWNGGACPVHPDAEVDIYFSGDMVPLKARKAGGLNWTHNNYSSDIVKYRRSEGEIK